MNWNALMFCFTNLVYRNMSIHSFSCDVFSPQSRRSTARSTAQATCAAGRPASWEQRERVRQTNTMALTSAAWWLWGESTPSALRRLTEKCRSNPLSSSHAMPWMANSLLLIKGRLDIQTHSCVSVMMALFMCRKVFHFLFLLQGNNYSWLPSSRVAWDVMLRILPSRWFTAVSRETSKRYVFIFLTTNLHIFQHPLFSSFKLN